MQKSDLTFDVNKVCRLCIQELQNGLLVNLFTVSISVNPSVMLARCTSIEVYEKDGLPQAICNDCFFKLGMSYEFRNRCEASDQKLRQYLNILPGPSKNELEHTKEDDLYATMTDIFGPEEPEPIVEPSATTGTTTSPEPPTKIEKTVEHRSTKSSGPQRQIKRKSQLDELLVKHKEKMWVESTKVKIFRKKRTDRKKVASGKVRPAQLEPPEQCSRCGTFFHYAGQLETHQRTAGACEKSFECSVCHRQFGQSKNLRMHLRVHNERQYQCEFCSKMFKTSSNLNAHLRTHSQERNYVCSVCERAFRTNRELGNHAKTHSEFKNFVCRRCGKAFVKLSYLKTHLNTVHVGLKRHRCQECGKQFSNSSNLIAHRRVHTGEKPYECGECDSKFNQSSALARHIRQQHRPKPATPEPVVPPVNEPDEPTIEVDENRSVESTASSELSVATSYMDAAFSYGGMPYTKTFMPQHSVSQSQTQLHHQPTHPSHFHHQQQQQQHHGTHHHLHHQPFVQSMPGAGNQQVPGANLYSTDYLPYHSAPQQPHYELGGYDMCYSMPAPTVLNPSLMNPQPTYIFDE
ncbi:zinc finger protein 391-like isoform X1 [Anopheles bellator]|uniref:zinc finger protein 391-like isoform X1 n=1 Tax=Anopheles bellator TaxID=139047 RepID=UPI0026499A76|nr:zinc finger protein 391-like isoform X1 [Anopheles bellator]